MKILFIGGTGRLSKDVALRAADLGNEVFLLTRGSQNRSLFIDKRYHMIYGDIKNSDQVKQLLSDQYFDVIIDFLTYNKDQLLRTLSVIENRYTQYIFISSAAVYKRVRNQVISEASTEIGNDGWSYAYNKYLCEVELRKYFKERDEKYTIIRPAVTYSNTRIPYPIVPQNTQKEYSILQRIYLGQPIPVFDEGKIDTTLTNSKDFAKGVVGLMGNEKAYGEAFHITSRESVQVGDVLNCLEIITGKQINRLNVTQKEIYDTIPYYKEILVGDKGEPAVYDNRKILSVVSGLSFDITLMDGLRETVEFYNTHPEMRIIDYRWMGEMDRIAAKKGIKVTRIKGNNMKENMEYCSGRYKVIGSLFKVIRKFKAKSRR